MTMFLTMLPMMLSRVMVLSSEATDLSDALADVATFFTWCVTQLTALTTFILGNPLAMIFIGMFIVGFVVALLVRILHSV